MGDNSKIEWADATWQVTAGCAKVSDGCTNCYAMGEVHRMAGHPNPKVSGQYGGLTTLVTGKGAQWNGMVRTLPDRITQPIRWRKPRKVFVDSLSDLFHPSVPFDFIDEVWGVMAIASHHIYQVLTKRPERAREYLSTDRRMAWAGAARYVGERFDPDHHHDRVQSGRRALQNVWLGTSVENQAAAEERIPHLLEAPAAVRWLSCEPLLGRVDMSKWMGCVSGTSRGVDMDAEWSALDWVVAGGESGNGARPMHPEWARSLRDQCDIAGVPFLFKQWGNWQYAFDLRNERAREILTNNRQAQWLNEEGGQGLDGTNVVRVHRVAKKVAGRHLDGELHDAFPASL